MATQPLTNLIDPPPRLTGDAARDTVSVIQWLNAFYTKGILSGALLQPQNLAPSLIALGALVGSANTLAFYTGEDTFDLAALSVFARTLLDDEDAAEARATLGAGTVTAVSGTAPIVSSGGDAPAISISDFVASGVTHSRGAVPDPGAAAGTTKFLREDATFAVPPGAGDVVGPAGATDGNVVLFNTATGKLVKDGGALGSAAFTASGAYDAAGAAAAAQAASQPADADLTTWAGITPGANVGTALAVAVGSAGAVVVNGGALGTPSSGTLTNASGLPAAGVTGTALVAAAIGTTVQAYDADLVTWAGVTPGANVATFLATPSSANLAAALTDETGSGKAVFDNAPSFTTGIGIGATAAGAGGIAFPAVAVAVADANTLDDYEEGNWTPALGGTATYLAQTAKYGKIGRFVFIRGTIYVNTIGTGSPTTISGLPFTAVNANIIGFYLDASATNVVHAFGSAAGTSIVMYGRTAAAASESALNVFKNGTYVDFSGCFMV